MSLPASPSPKFIVLPPNSHAIVTVLSELHWWPSHWDEAAAKTRRCAGPDCVLCSSGSPAKLRFVLGVELQGERRLLELRDRHRPVLELLDTHPEGFPGAKLRIQKLGPGRNSPVDVEYKSRTACPLVWDIGPLIPHLGLPALTSAKPELRILESA